jgi:hypothetical protein
VPRLGNLYPEFMQNQMRIRHFAGNTNVINAVVKCLYNLIDICLLRLCKSASHPAPLVYHLEILLCTKYPFHVKTHCRLRCFYANVTDNDCIEINSVHR